MVIIDREKSMLDRLSRLLSTFAFAMLLVACGARDITSSGAPTFAIFASISGLTNGTVDIKADGQISGAIRNSSSLFLNDRYASGDNYVVSVVSG